VIDGEIVAMSDGRPSFEKLQSRINLANPKDIERSMKECPVTFIAFDLLYLDGKSLISRPLSERKKLLDDLFVPAGFVSVSPSIENEGTALFDAAREQKLEGIVAKKADSPYRPGKRSRDWLKIKTVYDADVVIGGWTPGEGARSKHFGALLVGAYFNGGLRYIGSVGTGFTDRVLADVLERLKGLETSENPFDSDPRTDRPRWGKPVRDPHWVKPELVAVVEFRELTSAGRMRAPSFKRLRTDKDPSDCLFENLTPG
jgi:bifunctional non-homologous end joining protein LigD